MSSASKLIVLGSLNKSASSYQRISRRTGFSRRSRNGLGHGRLHPRASAIRIILFDRLEGAELP